MTQSDIKPNSEIGSENGSEDRRRPKSKVVYAILWGVTVLCVIFALIVMLNQG